ncbi:CDP-glycerol glycerophosphotransferase family protein [Alphaproteobacteria bacterium]|nr:CDP-glycerol glycerophosphotransferase family protein [Alphaproteobacteria bacterium]
MIVWSYFHKDPVAIHVTNSLNQLQLQMITQIANKLIARKKNVLVLHEGLDKGDLKNFKGCAFYNVLPIKRMHFESNFYKKLSLSPDNTPVLNAFSPQKWQRFMNSQAAKIIFFNSFFGSIKCSKLLTYPYGTNLGRAMRAGANLANVESYSLVTVMFAAHDRSFPVLEPYTKFLLYGEDGKELFLNRGIKEKNILVTGNPAYDEISMRKTAYVGSSSGNLKILIATSGIDKLDRSWLSIFQKLIRGWDVEVRLRPHPAVGPGQYEWIVSRNRQFSFSSYSLEEDINWSDVLLSDFSHVIVVCALLQRRMILINFSGQDFALRWDLKLKVPLVKNKVEFEDALTLLANEDSQHAPNSGTEYSTEGINYRNDGNALVRIVDALS